MSEPIMSQNLSDAKKVKEGVEALSKLVNNYGFSEKEATDVVAEAFLRDHHTLQQSMARFIHAIFLNIKTRIGSDVKIYTDPRNEMAIKWIMECADEDTYFPMV